MEAGPTYLLICGLCFVGVLGSFILFLDSDNKNIPILFSTIISIIGFAYGVQVAEVKKVVESKN